MTYRLDANSKNFQKDLIKKVNNSTNTGDSMSTRVLTPTLEEYDSNNPPANLYKQLSLWGGKAYVVNK